MKRIKGGEILYEMKVGGITQANSTLGRFANMAGAAIGVVAGAVAGLTAAVIAYYREAAKLAQVQVEAEQKLSQALRLSGAYSDALFSSLKRAASEIQALTRYGDEQLLTVFADFVRLGYTSEDQLVRMVKATTDLAEATGRDLNTAQRMVMMALTGSGNALKRYGVVLDENVLKTRDQLKILAEIERQVGGMAETMANTWGGKLQQIHNLIGDIKETFGKALTTSPEVLRALDFLKVLFGTINQEIQRLNLGEQVFRTLAVSLVNFTRILLSVTEVMSKFSLAMLPLMKFNPVVRAELKLAGITWDEYERLVRSAAQAISAVKTEMQMFTMTTGTAADRLDYLRRELAYAREIGEAYPGQIAELTAEIEKLEKGLTPTTSAVVGFTEALTEQSEAFEGLYTSALPKVQEAMDAWTMSLVGTSARLDEFNAMMDKVGRGAEEWGLKIESVRLTPPDIEDGQYAPAFERLALEWSMGSMMFYNAIKDTTGIIQDALTEFARGLGQGAVRIADIGQTLAASIAQIATSLIPGVGAFLAPIAGALTGSLWERLFGGGGLKSEIDFHQEIIINIGEGMISEKAFWDNLVHYYILPSLKRGGMIPEPVGGHG